MPLAGQSHEEMALHAGSVPAETAGAPTLPPPCARAGRVSNRERGAAGLQLGCELVAELRTSFAAYYFATTGMVVSVPAGVSRRPRALIWPPAGVSNSTVPRLPAVPAY